MLTEANSTVKRL